MILTQCAVCATELGLSLGKKCGRCSTRYCGPECQKQHWEEGGHDKLCKKIKKAGGAEQYYANNKYAEAVAVAVDKCADDTKGQKCYICLEAVHAHTGEGLVRGCACGDRDGVSSPELGVAHVSCLARHVKILREEAEENNLGVEARDQRWTRWHTCSLCEQHYHGVVLHALGWACWKTYVGRPETDRARIMAMANLGNGLSAAKHHEDALSVREAELAILRRVGAPEQHILGVQGNLALTYSSLGRHEEAVEQNRLAYFGCSRLHGGEHKETLIAADNYAISLIDLQRSEEAKSLLRKMIPVVRRVLGESNDLTIKMRCHYARTLYLDKGATLDDLREAAKTLEDVERIARRVLGGAHPTTGVVGRALEMLRSRLPSPSATLSRR